MIFLCIYVLLIEKNFYRNFVTDLDENIIFNNSGRIK